MAFSNSKVQSLKSTLHQTAFVLVLGSAISGCGGSVIYRKLPRQTPSTPSTSTQQIETMTLTPSTSEALASRGGALKLIFNQTTSNTSFDANNAQTEWIVEMKVKSESIDEQSFENHVKARMKILLVKGASIIMSREFDAEGTINLKNIDTNDQMLGTLRDTDSGTTVLSISAKRLASATESEASKNPWVGTLSLVESNHTETKLGDIRGFFAGLLTPNP